MSLGGYPMGAQYDPRAPWNQPDYETEYRECEECQGKGHLYYATNRHTGKDVEVTRTTYYMLPETEELAIARGSKYYRSEDCDCDICNGTGEIEVDLSDYYECDPAWRD